MKHFYSFLKFYLVKILMLSAAICIFSNSFSQWTRVQTLPPATISFLYHKDSTLYAGGNHKVYFSKDKGVTWDSMTSIPALPAIDNIIEFQHDMYVASFSFGVFKSSDHGITWQVMNSISPFISDFTEWQGNLYVSTMFRGVFILNADRMSWSLFNPGLSSLSSNLNAMTSTSKSLVAVTNNNALYDFLSADSTQWEERLLLGTISPSEGGYDIINAHDSLFLSGHTGKFYMSTDFGASWSLFSNRITSNFSPMVNAKEAIVMARASFNGDNNTDFFYIKKNALQGPFTLFSTVNDHYSFKIDIFGGKLWDASTRGLFFMSLSDLPGISDADDSVALVALPLRFVSIKADCINNKSGITWKAAQEPFGANYLVERSIDGRQWDVIGRRPALANGIANNYSFDDNAPLANASYRIAALLVDGSFIFSPEVQATCSTVEKLSLWPNPVADQLQINILTNSASQAIIKIYDNGGALVGQRVAALSRGSNQVSLGMTNLARSIYEVSVTWNQGLNYQVVRILKK